jgi:hypothetical protein
VAVAAAATAAVTAPQRRPYVKGLLLGGWGSLLVMGVVKGFLLVDLLLSRRQGVNAELHPEPNCLPGRKRR